QILKLKPGASWEEVRQAYKMRAKEWHPDRFPADDEKLQKTAHLKFHKITAAYTRLETWFTNRSRGKYADQQPDPHGFGNDDGPDNVGWEDDPRREVPQFITRTWPNGDKYEGMGFNDMMHGQGIFTHASGDVYTGQFRFGKMEGRGKLVFSNGDMYSGEFRDGRFHGQGKMIFENGDRYMGSFFSDHYHGQGVFIAQGKVYAGQWEYGSLLAGHH
ncbi:MAG: DnaJ domain-containing protein, partial [Nitrospinae bacterium]|nr:DnaJ domain-containing protein [Nitrospinota bacterium]